MIFTNLLTAVMRLEVFSLIFRKYLTKFGMMVTYLNWNISGKLHKILHDFLVNRKKGSIEWAILMGQC